MKKKYSLSIYWLFIPALVVLTAVSCTKTDNTVKQANLPRQFTPGDINIDRTQTSATLSWSHVFSTKGTTYTIQLSDDSTFAGTPLLSKVIDTNSIVLTDTILQPRKVYFARVKANAVGSSAESRYWVVSSRFSITGEQIFFAVLDADIKDTSVVLKWTHVEGLTSIVLHPAVGSPIGVTLNAADVAANQKKVTGLTPTTSYTAEIFKGTSSKGLISFTTKEKSIYAVILNPGDDLGAAITNAANGDIIGLMDGTYDLGASSSGFSVDSKNITIASVSSNPSNVTITNSDFVLKGAGAGIKLSGLSLTGPQNGYIVDINGSATNVGNITIENCKISFSPSGYAIVRANRGAPTMDTVTIKNTVGIGLNLNNNYAVAMMDKIKFAAVIIKNSTFSTFQRNIVSAASTLSGWSAPVTIDHCTFNDFGGGGKTAVLDGGSNNIALTITNSIFANAPMNGGGTVGSNAVKSAGTNVLQSVFYYNTTDGDATSPVALVWPSGATATTEISWTSATTDFTLPAASSLRTAATDNGPVGDPRWAH